MQIDSIRGALFRLTDKSLDRVCKYKYSSAPSTTVDNFLSKHIWTPALNYIPLWVDPNVLTLTGALVKHWLAAFYVCTFNVVLFDI